MVTMGCNREVAGLKRCVMYGVLIELSGCRWLPYTAMTTH